LIHPDDLSTFLGAFGKVMQNKKPVSMVGPYRLRDKDGEYHLNMGSLFPIISEGNIQEIAIYSRDISKNVQDETQDVKKTPPPKPAPAPTPTKKAAPKEGRVLA
jgi:hypothetical protein